MLFGRPGFLFMCYSTVPLLLDTALQLHFGILSLTAWRFALRFVTYSWEIFIFHSGMSWSCSQHRCPQGHANKEIQQQTENQIQLLQIPCTSDLEEILGMLKVPSNMHCQALVA